MSRYLTPLPHLLAGAIEGAINRAIGLDDAAGKRLAPLVDKCVLVDLKGLEIELFFNGGLDRIAVSAESATTPDTTISGTPLALLAMTVPDWRAAGSGVRIEGDAGAAQAFEKLLRHLDPDWEAAFVERLGPLVGHQLWRLIADGRDAARHFSQTAADQTGHFLRDESGLLATAGEVDTFIREVDELREAVDRLERRIQRGNPA